MKTTLAGDLSVGVSFTPSLKILGVKWSIDDGPYRSDLELGALQEPIMAYRFAWSPYEVIMRCHHHI